MEKRVKLTVDLDTSLDTEFRAAVFKRFGLRRGAIAQALIEAVKLWIASSKG